MSRELVCPRCRRVEGDRLIVCGLEEDAAGLRCPGCAEVYPVVDGVPIVLRDLDAWLAQEGPAVFARRDLPGPVRERLLRGAGDPLRRDARLLDLLGRPGGDLVERVRELVAALEGSVLDIGCGPGLHGREDAVGLELSFALARAFVGRGVVGDGADPPFLAHAFDAVLLLNVLDSCADPRMVLGQADALLRPGGRLVLATAYAWHDGVTPPDRRFAEPDLEAALAGRPSRLELSLAYDVEPAESRHWSLQAGPRTTHEHDCQLLVATKRGEDEEGER